METRAGTPQRQVRSAALLLAWITRHQPREGEGGQAGEGWPAGGDLPAAPSKYARVGAGQPCPLPLPKELGGGGQVGGRGEDRIGSCSGGGNILPPGRLAGNWRKIGSKQ
jgi:hypothetical protein